MLDGRLLVTMHEKGDCLIVGERGRIPLTALNTWLLSLSNTMNLSVEPSIIDYSITLSDRLLTR